MITVRFPNGRCLQYNDAAYLENVGEFRVLRVRRGTEDFIASVPSDCVIEGQSPCRVFIDPPTRRLVKK